jgi:hypothetical protein
MQKAQGWLAKIALILPRRDRALERDDEPATAVGSGGQLKGHTHSGEDSGHPPAVYTLIDSSRGSSGCGDEQRLLNASGRWEDEGPLPPRVRSIVAAIETTFES